MAEESSANYNATQIATDIATSCCDSEETSIKDDDDIENNVNDQCQMENPLWIFWNMGYLTSFPGILRIITICCSLAAFAASESAPSCHDLRYCVPYTSTSTFIFFGAVTFFTSLNGIIMILFYVTGHSRINLRVVTLFFIETVVLSTLAFLLVFANLFMISFSNGLINFRIASVLGSASFTAKCVHLCFVTMRLRALWRMGQRVNFLHCDPKNDDVEGENEERCYTNSCSPSETAPKKVNSGVKNGKRNKNNFSRTSGDSDIDSDIGNLNDFEHIDLEENETVVTTKAFRKLEND